MLLTGMLVGNAHPTACPCPNLVSDYQYLAESDLIELKLGWC